MELFVEPLFFEKSAAESALSEDPSTWPYEILQQVYKEVPFIADFAPHVVLDRTDDERGYAFGHVEVTNQTEIQHGTAEDATRAAGVRTVRIPVVVRERMLQPLDLLVTEASEMLPLTEPRLRQALFRPQIFDVTGKTPGDMSLIGSLFPPYRSNYGFGGGGAQVNVGMGKEGAPDRPSLLAAILPTIDGAQHRALLSELRDPRLEAALEKNAASRPALKLLRGARPVDLEKTGAAVVDQIRPSVVQLVRDGGHFKLKSASARYWAVREEHLSRPEALARLGAKVVHAADLSGSATLVADAVESPADHPEEQEPELVAEFGVYRVEDTLGRSLVGHVFPNLVDADGTELPLALFVNGEQACVQGEIFGVRTEEEVPLAEGHPRGHGSFYRILPDGKTEATIPLTIRATFAESGDVSFAAETFDAQNVEVHISPNIAKVTGDDAAMLVPDDMRWLPLGEAEDVVLSSGPTKTSSAKRYFDSVIVRGSGDGNFSFEGAPVEKVASAKRSFLAIDDALFILGGLGIHPEVAAHKLAEAYSGNRPLVIRAPRALEPASNAYAEARKVAMAKLARFPSRPPLLLKEGATIPDPVAADSVLSLGFLNAENLATFVTYLPHLDQGQKHMCELLIAARLGLTELPTSALERAIRSTEDVIQGLKLIAFRAE